MIQKNGINLIVLHLLVIFLMLSFNSVTVLGFSFCHAQGELLESLNSLPSENSFTITCTFTRTNTVVSTFLLENQSSYYICPMICDNISSDMIIIDANNQTHEAHSTLTFNGSQLDHDLLFVAVEAPTITNSTGNLSANTGQNITINISATDNFDVVSALLVLSNGTNITMTKYKDGSLQEDITELMEDSFSSTFGISSNANQDLSYYVILSDEGGLTVFSDSFLINVIDTITPIALFSVNATIAGKDMNILFNATNSSDSFGVVNYTWNFNDSIITSTNATTIEHSFSGVGTYNITLIVYDAAGNLGTASQLISIEDLTPPSVLSTYPVNNSILGNRKESIIINFSRALDKNSILNTSFIIQDSSNKTVLGKYTYNSSLNQSIFDPAVLLKNDEMYTLHLTTDIKGSNTLFMLENYTFNFTVEQDLDGNGTADYLDSDDDNDGILDEEDTVRGTAEHMDTTFINISIKINDSANLSQIFNGTLGVAVYNGTNPLLTFNYLFSNTTKLDLSNLTLVDGTNSSKGEILVYGLDLTGTDFSKTVYVPNRSSDFTSICVVDTELVQLSQISSGCNQTNEVNLTCDGAAHSGYTCSYQESSNTYRVTGLKHSAIQQFKQTSSSSSSPSPLPTPTPVPETTTPAASGGGAGGGSSGGSISASSEQSASLGACQFSYQCAADQQCSEGECVPIECPNGEVLFHKCVPYECNVDGDCNNLYCYQHTCVACFNNEHCDGNKYCIEGVCRERTAEEMPKENIIVNILEKLNKGAEGKIQLFDSNTNLPVGNAEVTIIYLSGLEQKFFSDANGIVSFLVKEKGEIKYKLEKGGYPLIEGTFQDAKESKSGFLPAFMLLIVMILGASYFITHSYFNHKKQWEGFDLKNFFSHKKTQRSQEEIDQVEKELSEEVKKK